MNETRVYHVETEVGELTTTDHELARQHNRNHPGSSMWTDVVTIAATALAALALTLAPTAGATTGPAEDEPGFSCVVDGNRICGPNNPTGAIAGCYDDTAHLVAPWPCHIVVDQNGDADVYTGLVDTNGQPVECRDICLGA